VWLWWEWPYKRGTAVHEYVSENISNVVRSEIEACNSEKKTIVLV